MIFWDTSVVFSNCINVLVLDTEFQHGEAVGYPPSLKAYQLMIIRHCTKCEWVWTFLERGQYRRTLRDP